MVVNNKSNFIKHIDNVILNIGPNEIGKGEWEKAKKHPFVSFWIEKGEIEVKEGSIEDITKVNANEAIEVVEYCFNKKKLEEWKTKESRKTVLEAIENQINELDGKDTEKDGE